MFKHILIPTDGSELSALAVASGVRLANELGSRVTICTVIPEFHTFTYQMELLELTREQYESASKVRARKMLIDAQNVVKTHGIDCDVEYAVSGNVYEAIIQMATRHKCDLILMASHGRRGIKGVLLGSETHKVLTHSKIPVLVYR
jgi:nucleotide-binding universal stress UspA family protein